MKTINTGLLTMTALIIMSTLSCKKESISLSQPIYGGNNYPQEIVQVTSSKWFSISNWTSEWDNNGAHLFTHNKNVPGITDNLLNNGKVLVFGRGASQVNAQALPLTFDQTAVGIEFQPGELKFTIAFSGGPQTTTLGLSFKYVLIPRDKLATNSNFNYNDYGAVCNYYNIPE